MLLVGGYFFENQSEDTVRSVKVGRLERFARLAQRGVLAVVGAEQRWRRRLIVPAAAVVVAVVTVVAVVASSVPVVINPGSIHVHFCYKTIVDSA